MTPGHKGDTSHACSVYREILDLVGDRWTVYVVGILGNGPLRFNELKRAVEGISQRMLTLTLRTLERDGLVSRTVTPSVPPRVDYALTEMGRTLLEPVGQLLKWGAASRPAVEQARREFDRRNPPNADQESRQG